MTCLVGVIYKGIGGFYYVKTEDGIFETKACGRLRKERKTPMIGDRVQLSENCDLIIDILPRKCSFIRPPVANVDQMVIVASVVSPQIDLFLIDALILQNEIKGIESVICINKADLAADDEVRAIRNIYENAGYKTIAASAKLGVGRDEILPLLTGKITAFAGNSGVGKSSMLNFLDSDFELETGSVSRIERGRHTTRHVELLPLSTSGFVVDTPGFSKLDLPVICADEISKYFREFDEFNDMCRFRGCTHKSEPDCAVINAVRDGKIAASRYESYKQFFDKLKDIKSWQL